MPVLECRSNLVSRMMVNNGQFKTVTWRKNNGEERTVNGRIAKNVPFSNQGYLRLKTPKGKWKLVNPRTISQVKTEGVCYKLKK